MVTRISSSTVPPTLSSSPSSGSRMLTFRGGNFSARHIVCAKVLRVFVDAKTRISDFQKKTLTPSDYHLEKCSVLQAFSRTREKLVAADTDEAIAQLAMLGGIHDESGLESKIVEIMESDSLCGISAAEKYLNSKLLQRLKMSPDVNMRNLFHQSESLLVNVFNVKLNLIGDIRAQIDALTEPVVLVCRDVPDSEMGIFQHPMVVAVVREQGGKRDHKTSVLKGINKLGATGIAGIVDAVATTDTIIVNGFRCEVIINPSNQVLTRTDLMISQFHQIEKALEQDSHCPAQSIDGRSILLNLNVQSPDEVPTVGIHGYDNVGLTRTEHLLAMDRDGTSRSCAPSIQEQKAIYEAIISSFHAQRPQESSYVVLRTLDLDGDKGLSYLTLDETARIAAKQQGFGVFLDQENFALYLMFKQQLEAMLLANGKKSIIFPNVFKLEDFARAMSIVDEITKSHGIAERVASEVTFGIMVEHPSIVRELKSAATGLSDAERERLRLKELKIASLGTNDLTRYTLGLERGHPDYDEIHPKVLTEIDETVKACDKLGISLSLCGDMGTDPFSLIAILGLGLRSISFTPDFVDIGRRVIRSISIERAEKLIRSILSSVSTAAQVRQVIYGYVDSQISNGEWGGLELIKDFVLDPTAGDSSPEPPSVKVLP